MTKTTATGATNLESAPLTMKPDLYPVLLSPEGHSLYRARSIFHGPYGGAEVHL